MAAMLRSANRTLEVPGTMLSLLLRLLAFRPDRDLRGKVIGGAFAKTRSDHATALRNAALGVMSCMELTPEQVRPATPSHPLSPPLLSFSPYVA